MNYSDLTRSELENRLYQAERFIASAMQTEYRSSHMDKVERQARANLTDIDESRHNRPLENDIGFYNIFNESPDAMLITHKDGYIYTTNKTAENLFGTLEEQSVFDLLPFLDSNLIRQKGNADNDCKEARITTKEGNLDIKLHYKMIEFHQVQLFLFRIVDITPYKVIINELGASKKLLRSVIDTSPSIIFVKDRQGRYLLANKSWAELFGTSIDRIQGSTDHELLSNHFITLPEYQQFIEHDQKIFNAEKKAIHSEETVTKKDASPRWFQVVKVPLELKDHPVTLLGIATDITWHKKQQIRIQESEMRYKMLFEDTPALICRFDPHGFLTHVNQQYCDYFSKERTELIGYNWLEFLPKRERKAVKQSYLNLTPERPQITQIHKVIKQDGTLAWQEWTDRAFFDTQGNPVEYQSIGRDITERKMAEEEIRKSERLFRALFENVSDGLLVARINDYKIFQSNNAAQTMFGYNDIEFQTLFIDDLFTPEANTRSLISKYLKGNEHPKGELLCTRKDGSLFYANIKATLVTLQDETFILGLFQDITESKRNREMLDHYIRDITRREKLQKIINTLLKRSLSTLSAEKVLLATLDTLSKSNILNIQFSASASLNCFQTDVTTVFSPNSQLSEHHKNLIEQPGFQENVLNKYTLSESAVNLTEKGRKSKNPTTILAAPVKHGDELLGVFLLFSDNKIDLTKVEKNALQIIIRTAAEILARQRAVRELKRHKKHLDKIVRIRTQALAQSNQKLKQARDEALSANRAKSTFLANISHELRTPLHSILGYAQLLRYDERMVPDHREKMDMINKSGDHLLYLLNSILEMSRIEAGRIKIENQLVDLSELFAHIYAIFRLQADKEKIEFSISLDPALPNRINTDPVKVKQVIINLLSNAFHATEKGKISVIVTNRVRSDHLHYLYIDIEDTGQGIRPEDQKRIFEAFEQTLHRTETGGTGLGLSISRAYAKHLGGDLLLIKSQPDKGSHFRFSLRANPVAETESEQHKPKKIEKLHPDQDIPHVLIVEDNPDNRALVADILHFSGFTTSTAQNGQDAIKQFEQNKPDIILMDIRMPGIDGYETIKKIRGLPGGSTPKILTLSAMEQADKQSADLQHMIQGHLYKPVKIDHLLETLQSVREQRV